MKRILSFLLAVIMCISFSGCGKTMCSVEGCENEAVTDEAAAQILCQPHLDEKTASEAAALCEEVYAELCAVLETCQAYRADLLAGYGLAQENGREMIHNTAAEYLLKEFHWDWDVCNEAVLGAYDHEHLLGKGEYTGISDAYWDLVSEMDSTDQIYSLNEVTELVSHYDSCFSYISDKNERIDGLKTYDGYWITKDNAPRIFCEAVNIVYLESNGLLRQAHARMVNASATIEELSLHYAEYAHYPALMECYRAVNHCYIAAACFASVFAQASGYGWEEIPAVCDSLDTLCAQADRQISTLASCFE